MRKRKQQVSLIFSLLVALLAVIFVVLNTKVTVINFGFFQLRLPLIIILVVMVIVGILIGWFLCLNKINKNDGKDEQA